MRAAAKNSAGRFTRGPFNLTEAWTAIDLQREDVRRGLVEHVGVHIKLHPLDVGELAAVGLEMVGGRVYERTAPVSRAPAPPPAAAATEPARAPRRQRA